MSSQNHPPMFKNRIAPPYLTSVLLLVLFLSSIIFIPLSLMSAQNKNFESPLNKIPVLRYEESTPLYQERMEVIAGKEESIREKRNAVKFSFIVSEDCSSVYFSVCPSNLTSTVSSGCGNSQGLPSSSHSSVLSNCQPSLKDWLKIPNS